jgi:acyl-CoA thioesterase-1
MQLQNGTNRHSTLRSLIFRIGFLCLTLFSLQSEFLLLAADAPALPRWKYSAELMRPFWLGDRVEGESVLFIQDAKSGQSAAKVLFPILKVQSVCNSAGTITYEEGRDFLVTANSREITLPEGSRIPKYAPEALRRLAKTQPYQLTHRDGKGEILFGAKLEYHDMQTCISYTHAPGLWKSSVPKFDPKSLPATFHKLQSQQPVSITLLGDSISTGANASGVFDAAPYQPGYPELLRSHLETHFKDKVELKNLAVGGTDTAWGLTQIDKLVESKPDLVIFAFGMNDSSGRPAKEYLEKTQSMIAKVREKLPAAEFILVATMVGNPDWVALKQELFPEYRDALASLCSPGIALADMTSIWKEFRTLKPDWDQTGNGVNHPNDFGHRVYAQVISSLLIPTTE